VRGKAKGKREGARHTIKWGEFLGVRLLVLLFITFCCGGGSLATAALLLKNVANMT
jgi:hypothetical protein